MSGWEKFVRRAVAMSFLLVSMLCFSSFGGPRNESRTIAADKQNKNEVVYVCACLKTKSCSCMTMAKTGGVCACGPSGGPPLKAVQRDSDWAKENRDALAK
jgi:hypothetical protein